MVDDIYEQYGPNGDPEWARYNYQPPPPAAGAPAGHTGYAPWTDPDTPAPDFLSNQNQQPPGNPGPGNYWAFDGTKWVIRTGPKPTAGPTPLPGPTPGPTPGPGDPNTLTDGSGPDYSKMLPFSPYREFGPFAPTNKAFSYEAFSPSSYDDLEAQPGYKEGQTRLQKQIEAGAAYRGMVRSGMTLGDLWTGLDTNKGQRFAEFDNRRFRNWGANRDNAAGAFSTNYGIERDVYDRGSSENDRFNTYRFNTEDSSFKDQLARWTEQVRSLTQIGTAGAN